MCLHHSNLILIDSLTFRFPLFLLKNSIPSRYHACLHLPFRGYWSYQLKSNNGSCSRQLSTYPRRRIPAFVPYGLSVLTQMERFVCYSCEQRSFPSFFVSKRKVKCAKVVNRKELQWWQGPVMWLLEALAAWGHVHLHSTNHRVYTCHISNIYLVYAIKNVIYQVYT